MDFKVPSTVPQDLLLIQNLIGTNPPPTATGKHTLDSLHPDDDSIASTDEEVESEDEVEADLAPRDEDGRISTATTISSSSSDSGSDTDSSSVSENGVPQRQRPADGVEDDESGVIAATTYLQTKNEIVDTDIMVPAVSEVEPCDTLEKVGEIMSIIGNTVIVRGLPVNHIDPVSVRALDVESLLVFEDRKVLGCVYETFGPTSQPLYQVKFAEHYPLDTSKVWLSREVFHVPHRSHFVFVDQLKKLRGSDASNIHDEEPAEDEIDFSDDEKEATFRAQRKKRHSASSSRQSTPASFRIHIDDMAQDTYRGPNPYDAHGPYDDDYHVPGSSRPPPVPYDDPYTDVVTSDVCIHSTEMDGKPFGESRRKSGGHSPTTSPRGRTSSRGARRKGDRHRQPWSTSERGYHQNHVAFQQRFGPDTGPSFPALVERATGYGQATDAALPDSHVQSASNAWFSPEANDIQCHPHHFIQPHINPRFASVFGLNLPPGPIMPWGPQNVHDHTSRPQHWVDTWSMHNSAGSEDGGNTYKPM